ncbi:hypothetical protein BMETH_934173342, partial [methanotrophic bacterial endosymbiont of Bathymodiolus sp.]
KTCDSHFLLALNSGPLKLKNQHL